MGETNNRDLDAVSAAFEEVEKKERKAAKEKAEQRDREKKEEMAAEDAVIDQVAERASEKEKSKKRFFRIKKSKSDAKDVQDAAFEPISDDTSEQKAGHGGSVKEAASGNPEGDKNASDYTKAAGAAGRTSGKGSAPDAREEPEGTPSDLKKDSLDQETDETSAPSGAEESEREGNGGHSPESGNQSEIQEEKAGFREHISAIEKDVEEKKDKAQSRSVLRAQKKAEHYRAVEALKQARVDARTQTFQKKLKAKQDAQNAKAKARQDSRDAKAKAKQDAQNAKLKAKQDARDAKARAAKDAHDKKEREKEERREEKHARWVANRPRRIRRTVITVIILAVILGGGGFVYFHYVNYFSNHFYRGTTINGTDVTYKTASQVKSQLAKAAADYRLTIREKDGKTETLTANQIGWKFADDGKIDELLSQQDATRWPWKLSKNQNFTVQSASSYSQDKLASAISELECLNNNITKPENAYLTETEAGKFKIVKEVEGNQVDQKLLTAAIQNALDSGKSSVNIVKNDCYVHPAVTSTDKTLKRRRRQWNRLMAINISYEFGKTREVITGDALRPYISDNGEEVTLSYDWVRPEVIRWAAKYNTFEQAATFMNHDGRAVSVPAGGDYGWYLDVGKTADDLETALKNNENGARDPKWAITAQGWDNGGLTGTYIEVSLSEQKLYLYKSGSLLMSCDIVSGAPGADTQTRCGIFSIDEKKTSVPVARDEIIGADSDASSDNSGDIAQTTTRYWIGYDGTRGIREADWRSSFGGQTYQSAGTLGSIDVSKNDMKTIYSNVKAGTPVVVYDDSGAAQLPSITVVSSETAITNFNSQDEQAAAEGQTDSSSSETAASSGETSSSYVSDAASSEASTSESVSSSASESAPVSREEPVSDGSQASGSSSASGTSSETAAPSTASSSQTTEAA